MRPLRYRTDPTANRGWTLPTTLFALAVLSSSVRFLALESIETGRLITDVRRGDTFRDGVMAQLSSLITRSKGCSEVTLLSDRNKTVLDLCSEGIAPFLTSPEGYPFPQAIVDYDAIFRRASACGARSVPTNLSPRTGLTAPRDCRLDSITQAETIVVDNLVGESTTVSPHSDGAAILATPGSLHITGDLLVSGDTILVAGGEISINTIRSLAATHTKITIISSRGPIRVAQVEGGISLLAAGRSLLEVPETVMLAPYPLPPLRSPSTYGFRTVASDGALR